MIRREKTPSRNDLCPCGSGKKAKKCCLAKIKLVVSIPKPLRARFMANAALLK